MNDLDCIAELSPATDARAARLVADSTHADLVARITAMPYEPHWHTSRLRKPSRTARLRMVVAIPVAVAIAAAVFVAISAGRPGQHLGPIPIGPAKAEALTFTRHGRYIDVIVRDPLADEKRYNAEFKAHGLHIMLSLVPASPSLVGTVVYFEGSSAIKPITAKGRCWTGGGGSRCPVGLRVPIRYHETASLVFGRAARPGERYETTVSATMPGEVLHGLHIAGHRVSAVLAMLRARKVTVGEYLFSAPRRGNVMARRVPLRWFVYEADPWAPGQVMLIVGKTRQPRFYSGHTSLPTPKPTPFR